MLMPAGGGLLLNMVTVVGVDAWEGGDLNIVVEVHDWKPEGRDLTNIIGC